LGLGIGILVAVLVAPTLLDAFRGGDPSTRIIVVGGVFLVIASLGAAAGFAVGVRIRRAIPYGAARYVDKTAGAMAGALGTLLILWLLLPAISEVPGEVSRQARGSEIAQALDKIAPRPPESLQALRQFVRDVNFPQVFEDLRPSPVTGIPPAADVLAPDVEALVAASTVRVSGDGCGQVMVGSGFSPEAGIVVTNAHVVAGVDDVSVERPDGRQFSAQVQVFDPNRDLAVLAVPGLGSPTLALGTADPGTVGAVFGHPGGQTEIEISPARIEDEIEAVGRNLYNTSTTRRDVFILAADLAPGDSGGPLVNEAGTVVGVAFAIAPDRPGTAYAVTDSELREVLDLPRGGTVSTGSCVG
jgi:S1-C subfamily serine protease